LRRTDSRLVSLKFLEKNGERADEGAYYRLRFDLKQFEWCSWWLPKFYLQVEKMMDGKYVVVEDLQRWLGMGGHAVLASFKGSIDKTFYHLHAFLPNSEPGEYIFPYDDHNNPLPQGRYKIWFQFKHSDRVFTAPFAFDYRWPKKPAKCKDVRS